MMLSTPRLTLCSLAVITALTACNGGGGSSDPLKYTGKTAAAAIDTTNADSLAVAATEAVNFSATSSNASLAFSPKGKSIAPLLKSTRDQVKQKSTNTEAQPKLASTTIDGDCGGSFTASGDENSGKVTYNNFCMDLDFGFTGTPDPVYISGNMTYSFNGTIETVTFSNITVTYQGESVSFSGGYTYNYDTDELTEYSDFKGTDGTSYRIEDANVSGDDTTGYYTSARIYHSTYGYVDITTNSPVMFNCAPAWQPSSGQVTITDSQLNTVSITYNSCVDATVTTDIGGSVTATTITW